MSDFLTRVALRALQPPAILPRLAARYEPLDHAPSQLQVLDESIEPSPVQTSAPATNQTVPESKERPDWPPVPALEIATPAIEQKPLAAVPAISEQEHQPAIVVHTELLSRLDQPAPVAQPQPSVDAAPPQTEGLVQPALGTADVAALKSSVETFDQPVRIEHVLRLDAPSPGPNLIPAPSLVSPRQRDPAARQDAVFPPRAEAIADSPPLQIEISIGSIEVKALAPAVTAPPRLPLTPHATPMSLDEYLRGRNREGA